VSEISKKGFKEGINSIVASASNMSLSNAASYQGHERIPESSPTERSSLTTSRSMSSATGYQNHSQNQK